MCLFCTLALFALIGREAGDCFTKCADLQKEGIKHEAATNYINASGCYKKVWAEGINCDTARLITNHNWFIINCFAFMNVYLR